jgi:membrane protein implicated in regulation of membrane protease activity
MTHQQASFRHACMEFAVTLLLVALSAFVTGYVVGSLGGSREVGLAASFAAMMAVVWWRKQRKARQSQRPA